MNKNVAADHTENDCNAEDQGIIYYNFVNKSAIKIHRYCEKCQKQKERCKISAKVHFAFLFVCQKYNNRRSAHRNTAVEQAAEKSNNCPGDLLMFHLETYIEEKQYPEQQNKHTDHDLEHIIRENEKQFRTNGYTDHAEEKYG